jgi:adenylate cyclase
MAEATFVDREQELSRLESFLDRALDGQGQICFVTGEAGSGKTALLTEFARRAQTQHADLVVAVGDCNAQTGVGDPYLPFREILALLTGDVEAKLAAEAITEENAQRLRNCLRVSGQALVDLGPELIELFVPAVGLATRAATFLAGKAGWLEKLQDLAERTPHGYADYELEQRHIFEQYTNVLRVMAARQPLMLILDDLHWSDSASIALLFHLARRIGRSRILVIGAYRQDEVAAGRMASDSAQIRRHPLEKVLTELKRYYGDVWVNLDETQTNGEGRQFVDALLDAQPGRFSEEFRAALFQHTGGHPLFTVELLRAIQERDALSEAEAEQWGQDVALDWEALPARVEGLIEERMDRLEEDVAELLSIAAVEGESFTAQVLARVSGVDEREVVDNLANRLDRRHHLVSEQGVESFDGRRVFRYRFRHALFQRYLYQHLSTAERELLHADVGQALEALCQGQTETIAVQLARHYSEARQTDKAVQYLLQAGNRSRRLYAYQEAIDHYLRALSLLSDDQETRGTALQLSLYEGLGKMYQRQARLGKATEAYGAVRRLAQAAGERAAEARACIGLSTVQDREGDHRTALATATDAEEIARATGIQGELATAILLKGWAHYRLGNAEAALALGEEALAFNRDRNSARETARSLNLLGLVHDTLGHYEQAVEYKEKALELFRESGDRRWVGNMLNNLGNTALLRGDYPAAADAYEEALAIARELGDSDAEVGYLINLGGAQAGLGKSKDAEANLQKALQITEATKWVSHPLAYYFLAEAYLGQGQVEAALAAARRALRLGQEAGQQENVGAAWRVLGMVATQLSHPILIEDDSYDATACFAQSVHVFGEISAEAERARTLREWARYEMVCGSREQGQTMWQEAREAFARLNMPLEVQKMTGLPV